MSRLVRILIPTAAAVTAVLLTAFTAFAQTAENTVITNTSTVSFTDANSNSYGTVTASVSITVGFAGGVDVGGSLTATPAVPSTGNVLAYTIRNIGNGTDSVQVAAAVSTPGVITITGYRYSGTTYPTIGDLNAVLSALALIQGTTITVEVLFDMLAGQGGVSTNVTLTGTSLRDGTRADSQTTAINPVELFGVAVTPDGQLMQHLPTGVGAPYSADFTVTNNGSGPEVFDLSASVSGAALNVVSVNGVLGVSAGLPSLAAGASATVTVLYTVGDVAAGIADTLTLVAVASTNPTTSDAGSYSITVVRPALAITKQAWLADRSAQVAGPVLPGDFVEYRIQVTNTGGADAASVVITDVLPGEVLFVSTEQDPAASWASITEALGTVTATHSGPLGVGQTAFFWIRTRIL